MNSILYNKWVAGIKKYDQIEYCRNLCLYYIDSPKFEKFKGKYRFCKKALDVQNIHGPNLYTKLKMGYNYSDPIIYITMYITNLLPIFSFEFYQT